MKQSYSYSSLTDRRAATNSVQTKAVGLQQFESSDISFKFVLGLQFSALVSRPSFARKPLFSIARDISKTPICILILKFISLKSNLFFEM